MLPTLRPGDRLLVAYGARVVPGSVVVAAFADGTLVVKRAERAERTYAGEPAWWLASDNLDEVTVDSRARGPVPVDGVRGVVRARLWPRPRRV